MNPRRRKSLTVAGSSERIPPGTPLVALQRQIPVFLPEKSFPFSRQNKLCNFGP